MALAAGTHLGPYEVVSLLGAGGMGEVYRARDTKLQRDVALKVLPGLFAKDPERLARFKREAQVLASLNHPNIAHIHGLEDSNEIHALVMELVEGPTLADRIANGPIPLDEALPIAKQIAEALEAAHEQGIIHRDLKPANIKVRSDGTVKVLDFGLAKALEPSAAVVSPSVTASPTITTPAMMTGVGVVLGTAAYMSPEQAKGRPADKRSDVWAFGCVLYEMLTGKRAFEGEDVSDTLAAVLRGQPDWTALPAGTTMNVTTMLRRCLQKDPQRRLPHIGVARLEIEDASVEPNVDTPVAAAMRVPGARSMVAWVASVVAIVTSGFLGATVLRHREPAGLGVVRFSIAAADDMILGHDVVGRGTATPAPNFALSPDGRRVAYVAYKADQNPYLWVRRLDTLEARPLPGTDDASFPFWSSDSRFIGFFAQGKLKKIDPGGGPAVTICAAAAGEGGTWNRDDVIVFARDDQGGLFRVSAAGGVATPLTTLDTARSEVSHRWPQFLPDGRHFLYLAMMGALQASPVLGTASLDNMRATYIGSLESADRTLVLRGTLRAMYGSGHLLFLRQATLMAQPFDLGANRLTGEPQPLAESVANNTGNGRTAFSVSDNGVLTYRTGITAGGRSVLSWVARNGTRLGSVGAPADYVEMHLSPDAKAVAALIANRIEESLTFMPHGPQSADIWMLDLTRDAIAARLTYRLDQLKGGVAWLPDRSRVAFGASDGSQGGGVYEKIVAGVQDPQLLFRSEGGKRPTSWSPDGRFVAFTQIDDRTLHRSIWVYPLFGDRKPRPLLESTFSHEQLAFSPDGHWIAYASDKGGAFDVYIRAFPNGDREWRISQRGGNIPQWRADGRELFYWAQASRALMAVPIMSASSLEPGEPVKLFDVPLLRGGGFGQYSVTPDGQRFLIIEPETAADRQTRQDQTPIQVVLNWAAALNRR